MAALEPAPAMVVKLKSEKSFPDEYSAKTTNNPDHLISSLKKLSAENLSNLTPHWLNVALNYSHPPTLERINALKKYLTV